MIENLDQVYAVVWHASGRVDFEPLQDTIAKNIGDLVTGQPVKRSIVDIRPTTIQAQDSAKSYRDKLKEIRKAGP